MTVVDTGGGSGGGAAPSPPDSKSTTVYHASAAGWWPQGDTGRLRAAADAWNRLAGEIDDIVADGTATVRRVTADNHGDGIDAFAGFWQRYTDGPKSLAAQADAARQIASACDEYADRIDRAKHEIEALRTAEVAIAVAGLALTIFTLGASDAAAGAAAAATVAAVEGIETAVADAVIAFVGRVLASAVFSAGATAASDVIVQAIRHQYDPTAPISLSEVLDNAEQGIVAGAAFGGALEGVSAYLTRGGSLLSGRLSALGAGGEAPIGEVTDAEPLEAAASTAESGGVTATGLAPNAVFTHRSYSFKTDSLGRVVEAWGKLHAMIGRSVPRDIARKARSFGEDGDEAGHLVAKRFGGPPALENLVPQHFNLNRGVWREMEKFWAAALSAGKDVTIKVQPIYDSHSLRPREFTVLYEIEGRISKEWFFNAPKGLPPIDSDWSRHVP